MAKGTVRCGVDCVDADVRQRLDVTVERPVVGSAAAWLLMPSVWIDAHEALLMGLVWQGCDPGALLPEAS